MEGLVEEWMERGMTYLAVDAQAHQHKEEEEGK